MRIASWDTRLVRIKTSLNETGARHELLLKIIEIRDGNSQAKNLRKRDLISVERVGDMLALKKQPISIVRAAECALLDCNGLASINGVITTRRAADQHATRPERRTFDIDANALSGRTARVQPPHVADHLNSLVSGYERRGDERRQRREVVKATAEAASASGTF